MSAKKEKQSFEEKLRETAEQARAGEAMSFEEDEVYVIFVETITNRSFDRGDRTWDSKLYHGYRLHFTEKGVIESKEPVSFWGNTVLDNELKAEQLYIIIYKGKSKGYHDYQLTPIDEKTVSELAKS